MRTVAPRGGPGLGVQWKPAVFATEWLILEHVAGEMPDIRAAALVAKELRNAVMSGYRAIGMGDAIPAAVSGHASGGEPSGDPHLAIAPLAFIGTPYASGTVFGFALVPPGHPNILADENFRRAMCAIGRVDEESGRHVVRVYSTTLDLTFAVGNESQRRSLDRQPYISEAPLWATCTPIVLDRHLKASGNAARQQEIEGLIRRACANASLPEPTRISAGKHSAMEGAPSAYTSPGAPRWTRWRLPESLASRPLIHAVVEFPDGVHGPVILGSGRFVGLGLCRPLYRGRG